MDDAAFSPAPPQRPPGLTWRGLPDFDRVIDRSRAQRDAACASLLLEAWRGIRRLLARPAKPRSDRPGTAGRQEIAIEARRA